MRYVQIILLTLILMGCAVPSTNFNDAKITQPELYIQQNNNDCYNNEFQKYKPIWGSLNPLSKSELAMKIIESCYP